MVVDLEEKKLERIERGQISPKDLELYPEFSGKKLVLLLKEDNAQKRTIAGTILGDRKDLNGILPICNVLKSEKYLYSR